MTAPAAAGCRHWGAVGAAGIALYRGDLLLLGLRSGWVMHGGTWGIPGGAIDSGETDVDAAYRELREETGIRLHPASRDARITHRLTWSCPSQCGWFYTTTLVRLSGRATALPMDGETQTWRWTPTDRVDALARNGKLHPGFADAWPAIRRMMSEGPR